LFNFYQAIISAKAEFVDELLAFYAPILCVGVFIGIIFFMAAGSFLYFRLFSDSEEDAKKLKMISKIGLTQKELRQMISRQVAILFFTPILVALLHGVVALSAMNHMFEKGLQEIDLLVLGGFLAIQVVYYLFARLFYVRKLEREL
ncbi:MAG: ABC transporter permease, partial [Streptococcaceae bacterium]|nr:ABC transporter permease [Streptococcaceae bacterium]